VVTVNDFVDANDVPQELVAVTVKFPDVAVVPVVIPIEIAEPPLVILPLGTVQLYELAPDTADIL
jgi:hypothetical protein